MNSIVVLFACLAAANAGVIVAPSSAKIIHGPSFRTTYSAPVAYSAPTALAYSAPSLPYAYNSPVGYTYNAPIAYTAHGYAAAPLAYAAAPVAYNGVVAENQLDTLVAGPSGTIATSKTVHRPALVAAPQVYATGVRYVL